MASEMRDGDDEDTLRLNSVKDRVRESVDEETPQFLSGRCTHQRRIDSPPNGVANWRGEQSPEPEPLGIVPIDRRSEFRIGLRVKLGPRRHAWLTLARSLDTSKHLVGRDTGHGAGAELSKTALAFGEPHFLKVSRWCVALAIVQAGEKQLGQAGSVGGRKTQKLHFKGVWATNHRDSGGDGRES
jgi:hypothetical protein